MKILENPTLPKEIFQTEAKPQLLAQAVRVFLANQRQGTQSALTRAEVNRTRKKLYKQKGTGGARHGDRKAPVFVGGGIAFAPKPRDYSLSLPGKMKKKALYGSLTLKLKSKNLHVVKGLDKLSGKTAELADFLRNEIKGANSPSTPSAQLRTSPLGVNVIKEKSAKGGSAPGGKKDKRYGSWLIITDTVRENVYRAGRNIPRVTVSPFNELNTYQVLNADQVLMMEEILDTFKNLVQIKDKSSGTQVKRIEKGNERREIKAKKSIKTVMINPKKVSKKK